VAARAEKAAGPALGESARRRTSRARGQAQAIVHDDDDIDD